MFLWRRVAPQSPEEGLKPTASPGYARNFRDLNRKISQGKSFSGYERNALFLNLKGQGFADVASLLGVDYDDDARAVATVDWDRDGDLDLWVTNRTAPRIRLLSNTQSSPNGFVALRLVGNGTTTNRDAIGARLTLHSASEPALKQIRTVRAGDGFLSQSSAWTHFGLGPAAGDLQLTIAWPGGAIESFNNLPPNAHHTITQGQGLASRSIDPTRQPVDSPNQAGQKPAPAGFLVANRVPFPDLSYTTPEGSSRSTTTLQGQPTLVTLWATWCAPCLKELADFASQSETLRSLNLELLALNVDGLSVDGQTSSNADPESILANLRFTQPRGAATQESLAKIELLIEFFSSRRAPLSIPTSFLLDAQGQVAAVYLEAVSFERVAQDAARLEKTAAEQLAHLSPRTGRWAADPRNIDRATYLGDYATLFVTNGFPEEAERLYALIKPQDGSRSARDFYNQAKSAAEQGQTAQAMASYQEALRLDPDYGEALTGLGALHLMQKQFEPARRYFEQALAIDPNHATALINLAMIDHRQGQTETALARLRSVIARNPDYAEAHLNLGSLLASLKNHQEAIFHLSKAGTLNPNLTAAHLNLAAAYTETEQWAQAQDIYQRLLASQPRLPVAHAGMGQLQARQNKHAEAADSYRSAIALGAATPHLMTQLALTQIALGEQSSARQTLQKALELDPNYPPAARALQELAQPAPPSPSVRK